MALASRSAGYPQPSRMMRTTGFGRGIRMSVVPAPLEGATKGVPVGCSSALDGRPPEKFRLVSKLFFNAKQLVVLGDAVGAAGGARFDLPGVEADGEVSDKRVFGLARAVGDDGGVAVTASELDGRDGFRHGPDLVELGQDGIGRALFDPPPDPLGARGEEVVAHELHAASQFGGEFLPAVP